MANFNFAKKFAAEKLIEKGLNYIDKDPEANFLKILSLADKVASSEKHHRQIKAIKENYEKNPTIKQYIRKLTEIADSYKKGLLMNFFVNSALLGIPYQYKMSEELGFGVPWAVLMDPTSACNLNCKGCWAGKYEKGDTLEFETMDRIINEAKELGIYFIIFSGGEPTVYPRLMELIEKHPDVGFMMYTNGTLIDDQMADKMLKLGNITPAISLEGFKEHTDQRRGEGTYDKIMAAMDRLKQRGIIFGVSLTATRDNVYDLFKTDQFYDMLIDKGAVYGWSFHYMPIGKDPNLELMLTPKQRAFMAERVPELRANKPLFLIDFWNDGTYSGGCIAGGRRYFHINAKGDVEPCAFVHFATDNIKGKSLKEVLNNPLFEEYQKRQPFNENSLRPCPIIDNNPALRKIIKESKAKPTHNGAEDVISKEVGNQLEELAARWQEKSWPIHKERTDNE
ncbi:MAG: radical SAM protein [Halanaerobiales bacterium]|nr:radical SAM protein [Halanaerobiales bacterium]